jgi:hypothetical protein
MSFISSIFFLILIISGVIALLIAILSKIRRKSERDDLAVYKGRIGESMIAESSKKLGDAYFSLQNVVIRMGKGTTQIDQIIVSPFGIFVLEIKNYDGWIFGTEKQERWTQRFKTGQKFQFQNPLIQNQRHIQALCALLKIPQTKFISVIIFIDGDGRIKTPLPAHVTTSSNYLDYIISYKVSLFTRNELDDIIQKIVNNRLTDTEHQQYIDKLKKYND